MHALLLIIQIVLNEKGIKWTFVFLNVNAIQNGSSEFYELYVWKQKINKKKTIQTSLQMEL